MLDHPVFQETESFCYSLNLSFHKGIFFKVQPALQEHIEYFLYNYTTVKAETSSVFLHILPVQHSNTNDRGQTHFCPNRGAHQLIKSYT